MKIPCESCNGRGLETIDKLCTPCEGSGSINKKSVKDPETFVDKVVSVAKKAVGKKK